jgi:hypothetical protein
MRITYMSTQACNIINTCTEIQEKFIQKNLKEK